MLSLRSIFGEDAAVVRETEFQILWLTAVLPPLGTAMLSPALDTLIGPFGASAANIGLMISVFTAPAIVIVPVVGVIADRYGRKPVLVSSVLLAGVAGVAIAFTTDFRIALALRLLQGIGFAGIGPMVTTSLGDLYTGTKEGTSQGLRTMASNFSGGLFPLVAGIAVVIAWQVPFLLYAVAIPIAVGIFLWFEEPTADEERAAEEDEDDERTYVRQLFGLLRRPRVSALVVARSLSGVIWIGFITYNSLIVVRLMGGEPVQAGILKAVGSGASAIAATQIGRITGLFESRFVPLIGANVCLGLGLVGMVYAPGTLVAAVAIGVMGAGFGTQISLYRSYVNDLASESLRAGLVSLSSSINRTVATLTPIAIGAAIAVATPVVGVDPALQIAVLGAAGVGAGGGILFLVVARAFPPSPYEEVALAD